MNVADHEMDELDFMAIFQCINQSICGDPEFFLKQYDINNTSEVEILLYLTVHINLNKYKLDRANYSLSCSTKWTI